MTPTLSPFGDPNGERELRRVRGARVDFITTVSILCGAVGGDIELMLNRRALIGAFPCRYEGLRAVHAGSLPFSMPETMSRRSAMPPRQFWQTEASVASCLSP